MAFDDTRAARKYRRARALEAKESLRERFPPGAATHVIDGPFEHLPAIVERVLDSGDVRALVEVLGRMTPIRFSPAQLDPAA